MTGAYTDHKDSLPGGPSEGHQKSRRHSVVVDAICKPIHSKVDDLHQVVGSNETVSSGQIPMDDIEGLEVLHTGSHLCRHVDEAAVA